MASMMSIEKRFPWSFLGFLLGTIGLVISIWFYYLTKQEGLTNLAFHVEDEFPLVELREKFPDIKVLFNNEDIIKSGKSIKIIRLRLVNDGITILQSYFDNQLPFGLEFIGATILAVSPDSSSGGYLQDNLFREFNQKEFQAGKLILNKPIIEKGSQLSFKVYLLQEQGLVTTKIQALGKISGLDSIQVVQFAGQKDHQESKRGTKELIAISLAAGYFGMLALGVTFLLIISYLDYRQKISRKKCCAEFINENKMLTQAQKEIISSYESGWRQYYLPTIRTLISGGDALDISELIPRPWKYMLKIGFPIDTILMHSGLLPLRWEPSVFTVVDRKISLNVENKDMLIALITKCGEINIP